MRKNLALLIVLMIIPFKIWSQSYNDLWKQVRAAGEKDQPRTQIGLLQRIADKAKKEKAYGQLLAATLQQAGVEYEVAPDSIAPRLKRLEEAEAHAGDLALQAVYDAVLSSVYAAHPNLDGSRTKSQEYKAKALAHTDLLARTKALGYAPFVEKGVNSSIFDDDLLHVIGFETDSQQWLHEWYKAQGNREAACLLATDLAHGDTVRLDSIMAEYADLPACGHAAIARYQSMPASNNAERKACYDFLHRALAQWGDWQEMDILRNALKSLTNPYFTINMNQRVLHPQEQGKVQVNVCNLPEVRIRITRTDLRGDDEMFTQYQYDTEEFYNRLKRHLDKASAQTVSVAFPDKASYETCEDSVLLPRLAAGIYLVEVLTDNKSIDASRQLIAVSNLRALQLEQPGKEVRYAVVRADNGQPVAGAALRLTLGRFGGQETVTLTTDKNGEARYRYAKDREKPREIFVSTAQDQAFPNSACWTHFAYQPQQEAKQNVRIFTDRSIYRPAQTVNVSVMAWTVKGTEAQTTAHKSLTLTLRDANGREVERKSLTTDDLGTANAQFLLPATGLTGRFSISTDLTYEAAFIQVEEYKRPTFEVTFDDYKARYAPGDTLSVQGLARTYSGVPVQGATVAYTIVRRPALWWRWWMEDGGDTEVYHGYATTDDEGHFQATVPLSLDKNMDGVYRFEVRADVTDQAGESHKGTTTLPVSRKATILTTDLQPKRINTDTTPWSLQYRNAAGKEVEATVSYGFFPADSPLTEAEMAAQLTLSAAANSKMEWPQLKSGRWTLVARCANDTLRQDVVVFSLSDKRPVVATHDWFYQSSETFPRDGKPVWVQLGASDANQHIVYSVMAGDRVIEEGRIDQSNALTLMKFKYKEEYGDGLRLCFAWVHDGIIYDHSTTISRPLPEKQLKLSWRTFRDRLTPGQQEEWTLDVKNPDGTAANAQFMATLYDKSLDQLQLHRWSDAVNLRLDIPITDWRYASFGQIWANAAVRYTPLNVHALALSHFNSSFYEQLLEDFDNVRFYGDRVFPRRSLLVKEMASAAPATNGSLDDAQNYDSALAENTVEGSAMRKMVGATSDAGQPGDHDNNAPVALRENLQETAFFYPQLQTDETGAVTLRFRLPESVTTWRLMGIAHDREMRHGLIEADVVAQKDVMVQPNLPRFVRQGDHAIIATRISNTTEQAKRGVARLLLLNPADESVVFEQEHPFDAEGQKTVSVSFDVAPAVLEGHEGLLIARIIAQGDGFSDGEQHYLPVLTNKEYVTTTLPFSQNEPGTLRLDIARLFQGNGIEQPRITVEYTNNPSWLMIQALPYVGNADEKNAISLTASIYANSLGSYIVAQNPRLKTIFKLWQQETGKETSLQSQLEKNEQLKQLVLTETPWVGDAQSETAQRRAIATYFDENQLANTLTKAMQSLTKLQREDGSFSWWEGMEGSFPMTVAVVKTLTRLQVMTGKDQKLNAIVGKAFGYLDAEVAKRVSELKRLEQKGAKDIFPSDALCDYLYTNALAQRGRTADTDYLLRLLSRRPTVLSIYGKANTAIILAQYGQTAKAKEYLKSLAEYTVYKEETGRYYDTPRAQYSWRNYRIPTQVAAIEAFHALSPDDTLTIQEMQRWLLQEKRTQAWDTPLNAVDALWAFADNGRISQLAQTGQAARIAIDGQAIAEQPTAGQGYVRHTEPLSHIPQTVTVEKATQGTSWGAAYAQYLQPTTNILASAAGLTIQRELLDKEGNPATDLKVGDRVRVRITILAERDYDFVMISDKRAACLEPVTQQSGYQWGYYLETRDQSTRYFFDHINKGKHVVETEYYVDREGIYQSGTCTAQCAYAPEYNGRTACETLKTNK